MESRDGSFIVGRFDRAPNSLLFFEISILSYFILLGQLALYRDLV